MIATGLRNLIRVHGPISMAQFMAITQGHPEHGTYAGEAIGARGHFMTAPEISQIFGELIGLVMAQAWLDQGSPSPFILAEAGPGRGTLMADALRAAQAAPGFAAAMQLHLIEPSAWLRADQHNRLSAFAPCWHVDATTLPDDLPLFMIANEFLDVLPVHQFVRQPDGWSERLVGLDEDGRFVFLLDQRSITGEFAAADDAAMIETSPAREAWVQALAGRIADAGGLLLLVDYGDVELEGETLQAVSHHQRVDPLAAPGDADVSSHVDFGALARVANRFGCDAYGPLAQGALLERLGIQLRLDRLRRGRESEEARMLASGVSRLIADDAMGHLFKAMAVIAAGAPLPPGFDPSERWGPR